MLEHLDLIDHLTLGSTLSLLMSLTYCLDRDWLAVKQAEVDAREAALAEWEWRADQVLNLFVEVCTSLISGLEILFNHLKILLSTLLTIANIDFFNINYIFIFAVWSLLLLICF